MYTVGPSVGKCSPAQSQLNYHAEKHLEEKATDASNEDDQNLSPEPQGSRYPQTTIRDEALTLHQLSVCASRHGAEHKQDRSRVPHTLQALAGQPDTHFRETSPLSEVRSSPPTSQTR